MEHFDASPEMASPVTPKRVKAIYNFKGTNNDELCFQKDDMLTLTQTPDGGWWEGTLNAITGWFPSNYVEPYRDGDGDENISPIHIKLGADDFDLQQYRSMVFKDIMDTEASFIRELQETLNKYLIPLQQLQIIAEIELSPVILSIQEICSLHRQFLSAFSSLSSLTYKDQRIGGVFLDFASQIKDVHFEYCAIHTKFVHLIEKYKKEICNFFNTTVTETQSGNVQLTTHLSTSFRRLDKYPALLQELQRYTDECHSDRGDTQRAGFVYRDMSMLCLEFRRQKEMEFDVINGNIKNWDGDSIQTYGEMLKMGSVSVKTSSESNEISKDRFLVLFPQYLVILSVSTEMDSFVYDTKLKLDDIVIRNTNDSEGKLNGIEIEMKDKTNRMSPLKPTNLRSNTPVNNSLYENQRKTVPSSSISDSSSSSNVILSTPQRAGSMRSQFWSSRCLTPHPPLRINNNNAHSSSKINNKHNDGDMLILQVIESYCLSAKTRKTTNSTIIDTPVIIVSEEEKIPEDSHRNLQIEERGFADAIYSLQEEIRQLRSDLKLVSDGLRAEKKARKRLTNLVNEHLNK